MLKTSPLTADDFSQYEKPSIAGQLPVVFENGHRLNELYGHCQKCGHRMEPERFRGSLSRAFAKVAVLSAIGYCEDCNLYSRFHYRFHDDGSRTGTKNGVWTRWVDRPSMIQKVLSFARNIFSVRNL